MLKVYALLALVLLGGGLSAGFSVQAGEQKGTSIGKQIPLDWDWKPGEITEMKASLKDVKTLPDGVYEYEGPTWTVRSYHTPRFTIQVSRYMEMFSEILGKAFPVEKESNLKEIKPIMTVYPNESAYLEVCKLPGSAGVFMIPSFHIDQAGNPIDIKLLLATFYVSGEKEPSFDKRAPLGVIQHEATHCLLQKSYGTKPIPVWLTEGAATYFESWDIRRKISEDEDAPANAKIRTDRRSHSWRLRALQEYTKRKGGELPKLDYLTSLDTHEKWDADQMGDQTGYHYCLAESFIDYLMNSKKRRPFLYTIIQRLHDGVKPIITPDEQLDHEKAWLMFLDEKWGVKFDPLRIKQRVQELKERASHS